MSNKLNKIYLKLSALNDSLLPMSANASAIIHDDSWVNFNSTLDELAQATGEDHYLSLKVTPLGSRRIMLVSNFSSNVYQAVNYLWETQMDNLEAASGPQKPRYPDGNTVSQTSVLNQNQSNPQTQVTEVTTNVNIEFNQTLSFITEKIVEAKKDFAEGTKERSFLDKLKDGVTTAKTTADLIKMIVVAAAQYGISADTLEQIFK